MALGARLRPPRNRGSSTFNQQDEEQLTEQLETLPSLCRFQLQQVASYVLSLFEPSAQLYQQAPISADLR